MWTRSELKAKAKASLKLNYWKTVLIALLVMTISGGVLGSAGGGASSRRAQPTYEAEQSTHYLSEDELESLADELEMDDDINASPQELIGHIDELVNETEVPESDQQVLVTLSAVALGAFVVLFIVILAVALVLAVFIVNPLMVGAARFFTRNLNQPAEVKEVAYGFDHNYREVVRTMFWRDVHILLWGLLLVIPGVVKAYQYAMVPYLLADDPTMTKDRALSESKHMMDGNKWRAFVLDLSFLGWLLLSILTLGVLSVFYVAPYKRMTSAALYERLRYGTSAPALDAPASASGEPVVPVPPFAQADAPMPVWDDTDGTAEDDEGTVVPTQPEA